MLNQVLGYMIAPDGNFISFGTWTSNLSFDSTLDNYHQYSALDSLSKNKWNVKYPELELPSMIDKVHFPEDIFFCFTRWSQLGFLFLINGNTAKTKEILGYFPSTSSFFQKVTLLHLRNKVLYQEAISSTIFVQGKHQEDLDIYTIYAQRLQELFMEDKGRKKIL